jgi:hypothetical protein
MVSDRDVSKATDPDEYNTKGYDMNFSFVGDGVARI